MHIDETLVVPTHRCILCGALWRYWRAPEVGGTDSWNLRSEHAGECCKDAPMGEQIEPLKAIYLLQWIKQLQAGKKLTDYEQGALDLYARLAMRAANHFHANQAIDEECIKENRLVMDWASTALESVAPKAYRIAVPDL